MPSPPPTIIVVHAKEKRRKCSVNPLRGKQGFCFWKYPLTDPKPLDHYVRLGFGGPLLSEADQDRGLLVLDATWRLVDGMERTFENVPIRSLPASKTAYPRLSKMHENPQEGLATIEAIYIALRLLGRDTQHLLDDYPWADEFLRLNREWL
jgi:pre-rRNA-processing protein TSR3